MNTIKKKTNSKEKINKRIKFDNPYSSIEYRLKRLKKDEKEVLTDLYCAVQDAIKYIELNIEAISLLDDIGVDEKNQQINDELETIKSYEIFEDMLSIVLGPKHLVKVGLWVKRKPEDDDINNLLDN